MVEARKSTSKNDDVQSQKSIKSTASKSAQKNKQVLSVVNQIFTKNGFDKVTNLEKEFANGSKYRYLPLTYTAHFSPLSPAFQHTVRRDIQLEVVSWRVT